VVLEDKGRRDWMEFLKMLRSRRDMMLKGWLIAHAMALGGMKL
jgi:hypothetical protein